MVASYALTSRGLLPDNFRRVAGIIYRALSIAKELRVTRDAEVEAGSKSSLVSRETIQGDKRDYCDSKILELRQEVIEWMCTFSVPWE